MVVVVVMGTMVVLAVVVVGDDGGGGGSRSWLRASIYISLKSDEIFRRNFFFSSCSIVPCTFSLICFSREARAVQCGGTSVSHVPGKRLKFFSSCSGGVGIKIVPVRFC